MPDDFGRPPSKDAQEREAQERSKGRDGPPSDIATEAADPAAPEIRTPAPPRGEGDDVETGRARGVPPPVAEIESRVPGKSLRSEIAKNFKAHRAQMEAKALEEAAEDMRDLGLDGLPEELRPQTSMRPVGDEVPAEPEPEPETIRVREHERKRPAREPEPEPEPQPEPQDEEPRWWIKVRGKEMHLTEKEIFALAEQAAGHDDYVREGREVLDGAKKLKAEIEAERASLSSKRPAGDQNTQTAEPEPIQPAEAEHPDSLLADVIDAIQFGSKEDAAKKLQAVIDSTVSKRATDISRKESWQNRIQDAVSTAMRQAVQFQKENPDLVADKFATSVIKDRVLEMQYEDLTKIPGVDPTKLPRDPVGIQNMHVQYRAAGTADLRDALTMLNAAKTEWNDYRGVKPTQPEPAKPKETARAKVMLSPDRMVRRQTVQTQPTRTSAPKQDASQAKPDLIETRSSAVQAMMRSRNLPRSAARRAPGQQ